MSDELKVREILKTFLLRAPMDELIREVFDVVRQRSDVAGLFDPLTETELLEMNADEAYHFRGLVRQIREDREDEPA